MNAIKITSLLTRIGLMAFAGIVNMSLTSCAGTTPSSVLTAAENEAWTAANALETANTASGGVFTKAVVDAVLVATHNTGDQGVVQAAASLGNSALAAQAAAKAANISPTGLQSVTTALLSDPSVIEAAAAAIEPKSTSMLKLSPNQDLKPWPGEHNPYDVSLAGKHIKHIWEKPRTMVASQDDGAPLIW